MRTGVKGKSGISTAYARYAEEDGDGLTLNPRGYENVLGTSPNRTVNGGFRFISNRYKNQQSEFRLDFTDYQHQYFTSPKNSLLTLSLNHHPILISIIETIFAYVSQTLYVGTSSFVLSATGQQYFNDSVYGWLEDSQINLELDSGIKMNTAQEISVVPNQYMVQAIKHSHRYGVALDSSLPINYRNISNFGVGSTVSEIDYLEDRLFIGDSVESQSPTLISKWLMTIKLQISLHIFNILGP